jgi:hypothetical protein
MLDCQIFGMDLGWHHLMSVCIHAINGALLFLLLLRMTDEFWKSAFVAALFAWHPLRVESVAWLSERKDVLCAFFGLLTLLAYVRYAQGGRRSTVEGRGSRASCLNFQPLGAAKRSEDGSTLSLPSSRPSTFDPRLPPCLAFHPLVGLARAAANPNRSSDGIGIWA